MKIGIFDSGIGGLNITAKLVENFPDNEYYYFADNMNIPYGNKNLHELKELVDYAMEYFAVLDVDMVIVACNTVSTMLGNYIKNKYPFKIFLITPNIILNELKSHDKVAIMATFNTLHSDMLLSKIKEIKADNSIDIALVDSFDLANMTEKYAPYYILNYSLIRHILRNTDTSYSLILGCTHYTYYAEYIQNLGYSCYSELDFVYNEINNYLLNYSENSNIENGNVENSNVENGKVENSNIENGKVENSNVKNGNVDIFLTDNSYKKRYHTILKKLISRRCFFDG